MNQVGIDKMVIRLQALVILFLGCWYRAHKHNWFMSERLCAIALVRAQQILSTGVCLLLSFSCMFVHPILNKRTHSCTTFTHIVQGFFGSVKSENFSTDATQILYNHKNCITARKSVLLGFFKLNPSFYQHTEIR